MSFKNNGFAISTLVYVRSRLNVVRIQWRFSISDALKLLEVNEVERYIDGKDTELQNSIAMLFDIFDLNIPNCLHVNINALKNS